MCIDVISSVLGAVLDDENCRVIPIRAMRDRFNYSADGKIIVRDGSCRPRLARSRAVGVIVWQIEQNIRGQISSLSFVMSSNKLIKLIEELIRAKLVGIFRVEVGKNWVEMVP